MDSNSNSIIWMQYVCFLLIKIQSHHFPIKNVQSTEIPRRSITWIFDSSYDNATLCKGPHSCDFGFVLLLCISDFSVWCEHLYTARMMLRKTSQFSMCHKAWTQLQTSFRPHPINSKFISRSLEVENYLQDEF